NILSEELEVKLLNNDFLISTELRHLFGEGLILSYKKDMMRESEERNQGVIVLTYPEQAGYELLTMPMKDVIKLRSFNYHVITVEKEIEDIEKEKIVETITDKKIKIVETKDNDGSDNEKYAEVIKEIPNQDKITTERESKHVRPLIGINSQNMPIYWEFNKVPNRHLLIGGQSGQGKTYFIQSLLMDLSEMNQSALIIDYSGSYTMNQLEDEFKEVVGNQLNERVVYHDKFPLNPFKPREKEVAGRIGLEQPAETARRVTDVFAAVYHSFGPQQTSALYSSIKKGIEIYGDNMRMVHLIEQLEALEGYTNSVTSSIISRIVQFADIDPFDYESNQNWEEYFDKDSQVTI